MCIDLVRGKLGVSERRACRVLGQHRSTQRHVPRGREDEERLVADMTELARQYGRYGYRRVAALLRDAGSKSKSAGILGYWRSLRTLFVLQLLSYGQMPSPVEKSQTARIGFLS